MTSNADEERRLVARLRAGDAAAFEELYQAYRGPIFGFLLRLAKDRHAAEDLFQNTWIKVSRGAARLREDTELRAWVFTVARNEFRSYRRWHVVDVSRLFLVGSQVDSTAVDGAADGRGAAGLARGHGHGAAGLAPADGVGLGELERALAALRSADREVLLLVCVEGLAAEEAALVLGVSHDAVRQRLGRARARLKRTLNELEGATFGARTRVAREA